MVVKQEVNFLESSEISLHKTTVNLWTQDMHSVRIQIKQVFSTDEFLQRVHVLSYCDRTLGSVLPLENRIISASLWKSSMDRAVSSARLLMAAAWTSWKDLTHTHTQEWNKSVFKCGYSTDLTIKRKWLINWLNSIVITTVSVASTILWCVNELKS